MSVKQIASRITRKENEIKIRKRRIAAKKAELGRR